MRAEELIAEGRKLARPCFFLRPEATGPVVATWYEPPREEIWQEIATTGERCWLTVDAAHVPGLNPPVSGFLNVFSNEDCETGRVEVTPAWSQRTGTKLYAHAAQVLPPIEAVFLLGSEAVGKWLQQNRWERDWHYNNGFPDAPVADAYWDVFQKEFPVYFESDIYAVLGGWHLPGQDHDWYDLVPHHLMVLTIRNSELWVEAWQTPTGGYKVIQRIT